MKVINHRSTGDTITYVVLRPNGKKFSVYYNKWTNAYTWSGVHDGEKVLDAVWVYVAKRHAWWSVPIFAAILCFVLFIS